MLSAAYPDTLTHLLVAACGKFTPAAVQKALGKLRALQLFDCGMALAAPAKAPRGGKRNAAVTLTCTSPSLRSLSLWGCCALQV